MRPRDWMNRILGRPVSPYLKCKHCGAPTTRLHMLSGQESARRGVKMLVFCRDCHRIATVRGSDMTTRAAYLQLLNQSRVPYRKAQAPAPPICRLGGLPHD